MTNWGDREEPGVEYVKLSERRHPNWRASKVFVIALLLGGGLVVGGGFLLRTSGGGWSRSAMIQDAFSRAFEETFRVGGEDMFIVQTFDLRTEPALDREVPISTIVPDASATIDVGVPAKVNINTADSDELQSVVGIGPRLATEIIEYRSAHGPFQKIDDLINVSGIGELNLMKMKDELTL